MEKGPVSVDAGDADPSKRPEACRPGTGVSPSTSGRRPGLPSTQPTQRPRGDKSVKGDGAVWITQTKPSKHETVPAKRQKYRNASGELNFMGLSCKQ